MTKRIKSLAAVMIFMMMMAAVGFLPGGAAKAAAGNYITNPGFEGDGRTESGYLPSATGWTTTGDQDADFISVTWWSHTGINMLFHSKATAYKVTTSQLVTGLPNGLYTLKAYVISGGGQKKAQMGAKNYGGPELSANLLDTKNWTMGWMQVSIYNINVANGQCEVYFMSDGNANDWMGVDDVSLVSQDAPIETPTPTPTPTPTATPTPVPKDTMAPNAPFVNPVGNNVKAVTGKAEAKSTVIVRKGTAVIGYSTAKTDGSFSVTIPVQKTGTVLTVTAKDEAGNESKAIKTTVKDKTPPSAPTVNTVKSTSKKVTGKAEAGATIVVKKGSTVLGSSVVKSDGSYAVTITLQKANTVLYVTAKDKAGNVSRATKVTVKK
jgi:hypothetical protein